jgi:hypothetical protein
VPKLYLLHANGSKISLVVALLHQDQAHQTIHLVCIFCGRLWLLFFWLECVFFCLFFVCFLFVFRVFEKNIKESPIHEQLLFVKPRIDASTILPRIQNAIQNSPELLARVSSLPSNQSRFSKIIQAISRRRSSAPLASSPEPAKPAPPNPLDDTVALLLPTIISDLEKSGILYFYEREFGQSSTLTAIVPPLYNHSSLMAQKQTLEKLGISASRRDSTLSLMAFSLTQSLFRDDSELAPFHEGTLGRILGSLQRWRTQGASCADLLRDANTHALFSPNFIDFTWRVSTKLIQMLLNENQSMNEPINPNESKDDILIADIEETFRVLEEGKELNDLLELDVSISRSKEHPEHLICLIWSTKVEGDILMDAGRALLWFVRQAVALPLRHLIICPECVLDSSNSGDDIDWVRFGVFVSSSSFVLLFVFCFLFFVFCFLFFVFCFLFFVFAFVFCFLFFVFCFLLFAFCFLLFAFCFLLFAFCFLLFVFCFLLFAFCFLLFAFCFLLCSLFGDCLPTHCQSLAFPNQTLHFVLPLKNFSKKKILVMHQNVIYIPIRLAVQRSSGAFGHICGSFKLKALNHNIHDFKVTQKIHPKDQRQSFHQL